MSITVITLLVISLLWSMLNTYLWKRHARPCDKLKDDQTKAIKTLLDTVKSVAEMQEMNQRHIQSLSGEAKEDE